MACWLVLPGSLVEALPRHILPCRSAIPMAAKQCACVSIGAGDAIDCRIVAREMVIGWRPGSGRHTFDEARALAKKQNKRLLKRPVSGWMTPISSMDPAT